MGQKETALHSRFFVWRTLPPTLNARVRLLLAGRRRFLVTVFTGNEKMSPKTIRRFGLSVPISRSSRGGKRCFRRRSDSSSMSSIRRTFNWSLSSSLHGNPKKSRMFVA
jgi:hypothetical protein